MTDSSAPAGLALPVLDPDLAARLQARMAEVEVALVGPVQSRADFVATLPP